ncbi:cysteine ABC transporter ATP-binding protein [Acetivibrio ethanolgignens]|uniref:Cysteine ABC transporter ATP-binding protein n=2 Tax=Acetivibrio ethanolgignens TaxID=290052 RepID=A0A0V8QH69_9FIRM|nr:cysteine ABC transporter ATP-binding protein [Acetivibrio ethanolgignens]
MVLCQWFILLANVLVVYRLSCFVGVLYRQEGQTAIKHSGVELILAVFAAFWIRALMNEINERLSFSASQRIKLTLRQMIYEKLLRLGGRYREYIATSEAVQIGTEGVEQLEIYFGRYVPQFFYSLLAPMTLFLITGVMSLKVAVVLLLCVPLIPVSIVAVQKFAKRMLNKYWNTYTELGDSFLECLQGLTTLKIYQADERYAEKMDEEAERFRKVTMRVLIMQLNSISIMDLAAYGGAALGIGLAVSELLQGRLMLEQAFFIIMISAEFFLPLRLLGSFFHIAMNGNAAANKIFQLLDAVEKSLGEKEVPVGNKIELKDVVFGYTEETRVLHGVSLTVASQGMTALAGVSGCGKSTISALLMGEFEPEQGSVCLEGVKISEMSKEALRRKITKVSHDSYLFEGTVRENLSMGNPKAGEKEMTEALERVGLLELLSRNGGLDMELTEAAANLSGGQKQRLCLARALLHDSDIYIFDEATSNVDSESEDRIMEVVRELAKTKAVVVISHRLANITSAEMIYVLEGGRIKEAGTHTELCEKQGGYFKMYAEQKKLEDYGREAIA